MVGLNGNIYIGGLDTGLDNARNIRSCCFHGSLGLTTRYIYASDRQTS